VCLHDTGDTQIKAYCDEMIERLEESFIAHFETGEAGAVENSRQYLCEHETQECVGDPKQRLAERLAQQVRTASPRPPGSPRFPLCLCLETPLDNIVCARPDCPQSVSLGLSVCLSVRWFPSIDRFAPLTQLQPTRSGRDWRSRR
jgi:hypothetical protein